MCFYFRRGYVSGVKLTLLVEELKIWVKVYHYINFIWMLGDKVCFHAELFLILNKVRFFKIHLVSIILWPSRLGYFVILFCFALIICRIRWVRTEMCHQNNVPSFRATGHPFKITTKFNFLIYKIPNLIGLSNLFNQVLQAYKAIFLFKVFFSKNIGVNMVTFKYYL